MTVWTEQIYGIGGLPDALTVYKGSPSKLLYGGVTLDPYNGRTIEALIDGSITSPVVDANYKKPVVYIERHTNNPNAVQSSDWGSAYKQAAQLIEVVAYANEQSEVNGLASRVVATSAAPASGAGLVGISALAQCDAPVGQRNRDLFGANFACVQNTGVSSINMVGVEVDLVPRLAMQFTTRPNQGGAGNYNNWTAFVAQSAGTFPSNTAFFAGTSDGGVGQTTPGWKYGFIGECDFNDYVAYLRNTKVASAARGVYIETQFSNATGRVLECFVGAAQEQFRVDGDATSPVWLRRSGVLHNINDFLLQDSSTLTTTDTKFGTFKYSGNADLPRLYGGGSAGGFIFYGQGGVSGSGQMRFVDNSVSANTRAVIDTAAPTSGFTVLYLAYHNGTAVQFNQAKVGAADSGGVGFRTLIVPN